MDQTAFPPVGYVDRDEAARELFGEHARLNFPDGVDMWLADTVPAKAA